jgi:large exoprotein involved in heme utilization and adhesion
VGYLLDLVDSAVTTRVESGQGNGGNITIGPPPFVVLDRSSIIANASGGNGGNIGIRAGQLISTPDSLIQASSELGIAGNIAIDAPQNDIGGALAILPGTFLDGAALLAETCASRSGKPSSSLVAGGRGGLPPDPEQPLSLGRQADLLKAAPPNASAPVTGAAGRNRTPAVSSLGLQPACPG